MKIKSMYSVVMLTALTGCGLMEVGKTQSVSFLSNIDETTIFDRDGRLVCATPCEIELPRQKNDLYFVAKKAGYVNRPFFLTVVPEKSFFKHMLTSNVTFSPATTVDLATGAAYEYEPAKIYVHMIEKGSAEDLEQQRNEQEIRRFFMLNYDDLKAEASVGRGEKTKTLAQMMNIPENELAHKIEQTGGKESGANELVQTYRRAVTTNR